MIVSTEERVGCTQSLGAATLDVSTQGTSHQVTLVPTGATTGTATLQARAAGGSVYENVVDSSGVAVSISFAAPVSILFDGVIDSIKVTPTSLDSTASYVIMHAGYAGK